MRNLTAVEVANELPGKEKEKAGKSSMMLDTDTDWHRLSTIVFTCCE